MFRKMDRMKGQELAENGTKDLISSEGGDSGKEQEVSLYTAKLETQDGRGNEVTGRDKKEIYNEGNKKGGGEGKVTPQDKGNEKEKERTKGESQREGIGDRGSREERKEKREGYWNEMVMIDMDHANINDRSPRKFLQDLDQNTMDMGEDKRKLCTRKWKRIVRQEDGFRGHKQESQQMSVQTSGVKRAIYVEGNEDDNQKDAWTGKRLKGHNKENERSMLQVEVASLELPQKDQ